MKELLTKRILFTTLLPKLWDRMRQDGLQPVKGVDGEKHMPGSLHYIGLADDTSLYDKDGNWLNTTEAHQPYGEWWEQQHPDCRWGGRFKKPDGNHYSIAFQGKA